MKIQNLTSNEMPVLEYLDISNILYSHLTSDRRHFFQMIAQ